MEQMLAKDCSEKLKTVSFNCHTGTRPKKSTTPKPIFITKHDPQPFSGETHRPKLVSISNRYSVPLRLPVASPTFQPNTSRHSRMVKGMEQQTRPVSWITSPLTSPLEARTIISSVPTFKASSSTLSADDSTVDYISMLGLEDRWRRFSEEVEDDYQKKSDHLQKVYRQIQRQVHSREQQKVEKCRVQQNQLF